MVLIKSDGNFLRIMGTKMSPYESCDFPNASSARMCVSSVSQKCFKLNKLFAWAWYV